MPDEKFEVSAIMTDLKTIKAKLEEQIQAGENCEALTSFSIFVFFSLFFFFFSIHFFSFFSTSPILTFSLNNGIDIEMAPSRAVGSVLDLIHMRYSAYVRLQTLKNLMLKQAEIMQEVPRVCAPLPTSLFLPPSMLLFHLVCYMSSVVILFAALNPSATNYSTQTTALAQSCPCQAKKRSMSS